LHLGVGDGDGTSGAPSPAFVVPIALPIRLVVAAIVVTWGALTDRRWTVPLASAIALPVLWINGFAMLIAIIPLLPRVMGTTPASRWLDSLPAQPPASRIATALP